MKPIAFPRLTANLVLSLLDLVQYPIFFQTQRLLANGSETLTALMDVALDLSWRVRYSGGVEDSLAGQYRCQPFRPGGIVEIEPFHSIPGGIMPGRKRFAYT